MWASEQNSHRNKKQRAWVTGAMKSSDLHFQKGWERGECRAEWWGTAEVWKQTAQSICPSAPGGLCSGHTYEYLCLGFLISKVSIYITGVSQGLSENNAWLRAKAQEMSVISPSPTSPTSVHYLLNRNTPERISKTPSRGTDPLLEAKS